jgi:flagellar biosynthesis chaperone FliJ
MTKNDALDFLKKLREDESKLNAELQNAAKQIQQWKNKSNELSAQLISTKGGISAISQVIQKYIDEEKPHVEEKPVNEVSRQKFKGAKNK